MKNIMIYKVSYVVQGGKYPGGIMNQYEPPKAGDIVTIGPMQFEVVEIHQIMPPRGGFHYLHATVKPVEALEKAPTT